MTITLFALAWLLCGFVWSYIGWRFIDRRAYDLEVFPLIIGSISGGMTLVGVVIYLVFTSTIYGKVLSTVVFKRKL